MRRQGRVPAGAVCLRVCRQSVRKAGTSWFCIRSQVRVPRCGGEKKIVARELGVLLCLFEQVQKGAGIDDGYTLILFEG